MEGRASLILRGIFVTCSFCVLVISLQGAQLDVCFNCICMLNIAIFVFLFMYLFIFVFSVTTIYRALNHLDDVSEEAIALREVQNAELKASLSFYLT